LWILDQIIVDFVVGIGFCGGFGCIVFGCGEENV